MAEENKICKTRVCNADDRISQGDIFRNVMYLEGCIIKNDMVELSTIIFPSVIILSQDCDLDHDFSSRNRDDNYRDKALISVLVAPVYNAEFVLKGNHLDQLKIEMRKFIGDSKTAIRDLKQNNNLRYHYLNFGKECLLPPSIVDFKHYFSVNTKYLDEIKGTDRLFRIKELYREDISQRFSSFLSRVGTPDD